MCIKQDKKEHTVLDDFGEPMKSNVNEVSPFSHNTMQGLPNNAATLTLLGRKTFTGGALNMGLVASNTDQLLTVITSKIELDGLDIAKIVLLSISLAVQVIII